MAPSGPASDQARKSVDRLLRRRRWRVDKDSRNREALAVAFDALDLREAVLWIAQSERGDQR